MNGFSGNKNTSLLIIGDLVSHIFSLIFTLAIRYGEIPDRDLLGNHTPSFFILWALFTLVSFSLGLYDKRIALIRDRFSSLVFKVQAINILIGVIFFYFAPVGITPRANLFIYFIISTAMIFLWRMVMYPVFSVTRRQDAILIGNGDEIFDLYKEINEGTKYEVFFKEKIIPQNNVSDTVEAISKAVKNTGANVIVANLHDRTIESAMPFLYSLIFSGKQIIDASRLYESVFDRIPLSTVGERWLVENSTNALGNRRVYDTIKRVMDIVVASITGILSLVIYPFIYVAIKIEDGGPLFVFQERIGKNGKIIRIAKFRSMTADDSGAYQKNGKSALKVTRLGKIIRLTRIDELPQLWSVIKGDQSLIGPRPELPALTRVYEKEIAYYNARHLIKPGLSGWAQIYHHAHPHHAVAVDDTRDKLSYDLFYVKNRSLGLDLRIALQTVKALISRQGV